MKLAMRPAVLEQTRCPYCHDSLHEREEQRSCASCDAAHHAACWRESGSRCASCSELAPDPQLAPPGALLQSWRVDASDPPVNRRRLLHLAGDALLNAAFWGVVAAGLLSQLGAPTFALVASALIVGALVLAFGYARRWKEVHAGALPLPAAEDHPDRRNGIRWRYSPDLSGYTTRGTTLPEGRRERYEQALVLCVERADDVEPLMWILDQVARDRRGVPLVLLTSAAAPEVVQTFVSNVQSNVFAGCVVRLPPARLAQAARTSGAGLVSTPAELRAQHVGRGSLELTPLDLTLVGPDARLRLLTT